MCSIGSNWIFDWISLKCQNGPSSAVFLPDLCILGLFHSFATAWTLAKFGDAGLQTSQLQLLVARGWGRPHCLQQSDETTWNVASWNSWGLGEPLATESKLSPCSLPAPAWGALLRAGSPASANSSRADDLTRTEDAVGGTRVGETETERGQVTFSVRPRIIWTEIKALWKGPGENYPRPRKIKPGLKRLCVVMTVCCASCTCLQLWKEVTGSCNPEVPSGALADIAWL